MAKEKKTIRIGLDLDGVVAQHPWGGFWVWLRKLKEGTLKSACPSTYYYPSTFLERWAWMVIDWMKKPVFDQEGILAKLASQDQVKLYIITSRFIFLEKLTKKWLRKHKLDDFFHRVLINTEDLEPIVFKTNIVKEHNLSFFIEDDLEVINSLKKKTKAQFFWIVPPHKNKKENRDLKVKVKKSAIEALKEILFMLK